MSSEIIIQTNDLSVYYGAHRGIKDLNLSVQKGEVFGFLGPNGAGKTTTLRAILDIIHPTQDAFVIDGVKEIGREGSLVMFEIRRGLDILIEKAVPYGIEDIETKSVSLEKIFLSFYGPDNKGGKND